ncbi:MAG: hypothetical protein H6Q89_2326 [Myxococcaceae bacterium]|nr:hypothetical protein [Myxococcaceae bacterium]
MQLKLAALACCVASSAFALDWDVPEAVSWAEVGEKIQANGMPMKIFVARSRWKPVALLNHYQQRFRDAGYYQPEVPLRLEGLKLPRVTALDTISLWSYLVYVFPEPDGTTTLVMGAADLKGRQQGRLAGGFPAPAFPGSKATFASNVEFARTLSFTTGAKEEEVIDFYRQTLPSGGWKERERGSFVRDGRLLRMLGKPEGKQLRIVLVEEADLPVLQVPKD